MIVYMLFDKVSKQFTPTFEQPTKSAAIRALKRDSAIMASLDDFLIFPVFEKLDMSSTGDSEIPDNFRWDSVIKAYQQKPLPLKDFLGIDA